MLVDPAVMEIDAEPDTQLGDLPSQDHRPNSGCVLIDFTRGEELVNETVATVPQLPQILVASTTTLGGRQSWALLMILFHPTCRMQRSFSA